MDSQETPLVSVCIPSYNCAEFIGEAVESVINQTYTNWELIVTDDASSDNSVEILRGYQASISERMTVKVADTNLGPSGNFNWMMGLANSEYIVLLATDDRMAPERIEKQLKYLQQNPEVGAVFSEVNIIDSSGCFLSQESVFSIPIDNIRKQLLSGNFINAPSGMLRTSVVRRVGRFNPELLILQDYDYWLRILDEDEIARLPEKLTDYRIHESNLSVKMPKDRMSAAHYETAIVCINTALRWADKFLFAETPAKSYLYLATLVKAVDQAHLGSLKIGASAVYALASKVLLLEPHNPDALALINDVYASVGDTSRAVGGKSLTISEWEAHRYDEKETSVILNSTDPLIRFKVAKKSIGGNLLYIATNIVENFPEIFSEKGSVNAFYLNAAKVVLEGVKNNIDKHTEYKGGSKKLYCEIEGGERIARQLLSEEGSNEQAWQLIVEFRRLASELRYQGWIRQHALQEIDGQLFAERMMLKWKERPIIHLIMLVFPGEEVLLADTLDSLGQQMYPDWRLSIIADSPAPNPLWDEIDKFDWIHVGNEDDPYQIMNNHIAQSSSDWVAYIEPGIIFEFQALVQFGDYINIRPQWNLIYCDEDVIKADGERTDPKFKPDFNLDMLRSKPYMGNVCLTRKESFIEVGGMQPYSSAENYDLAFRINDCYGADAIGHISDILFHSSSESQRAYNHEVVIETVRDHLKRNKISAEVKEGYVQGTNRVIYKHDNQPMVSIIIPNKDKLEYLQPCVESLIEKTMYPNYEIIIIDNNSVDPDTLDYYQELDDSQNKEIKVIKYPHEFNFSAMCNLGSDNAKGEFILFLNNDTKVVQKEWLDRLMLHAQRDDIGAVGARLVYPETGRIQHAGVILGLLGTADHPFMGEDLKNSSYMDRSQIDQNYSAVSAACLLVKRSIYNAIDKMDESKFAVCYNDVDLCLKISGAGYRIIWTPFSTLVHHGSISQRSDQESLENRVIAEKRLSKGKYNLYHKWGSQLALDPAYNPNLSLAHCDFRLEVSIPRNWDINFHDRLRILGIPIPGGSGEYRLIQPFQALSTAGLAQCEYYRLGDSISRKLNTAEIIRLQPDVTIAQVAIDDLQMSFLEELEQFVPDVFRIFTMDDLITKVPEKSSTYRSSKRNYPDARSRLRKALSHSQRLIVSTQPLADYCAELIDDIRVIPNRLSREKWGNLSTKRGQSEKLRVGWVGAQQHQGDLELIYDVVKATADEFDWVFMGMCPEAIKPYVKESHGFVAISDYPEKMASLNLDIAVAPLEINQFNEAKSNLRLLEYGVLGWPVVCTDIYPYRTANAPVKRVENTLQDWISALREYGNNAELREAKGDELRRWVLKHYILEEHLDELYDAFSGNAKESIEILQRQSA